MDSPSHNINRALHWALEDCFTKYDIDEQRKQEIAKCMGISRRIVKSHTQNVVAPVIRILEYSLLIGCHYSEILDPVLEAIKAAGYLQEKSKKIQKAKQVREAINDVDIFDVRIIEEIENILRREKK